MNNIFEVTEILYKLQSICWWVNNDEIKSAEESNGWKLKYSPNFRINSSIQIGSNNLFHDCTCE